MAFKMGNSVRLILTVKITVSIPEHHRRLNKSFEIYSPIAFRD